MATHACVDCLKEDPDGTRPPRKVAVDSKPLRCATHARAFKVRQRKQARANHVENTYDISAKDNHALILYQGGKCWLCGKATGATKALAVDHDHNDDWVRGRLCGPDNQWITRALGDDPKAAMRLVRYLSGDTPFRRMLAERAIRQAYPGTAIDEIRLMVEGVIVDIWWLNGSEWHVWKADLETLSAFRS